MHSSVPAAQAVQTLQNRRFFHSLQENVKMEPRRWMRTARLKIHARLSFTFCFSIWQPMVSSILQPGAGPSFNMKAWVLFIYLFIFEVCQSHRRQGERCVKEWDIKGKSFKESKKIKTAHKFIVAWPAGEGRDSLFNLFCRRSSPERVEQRRKGFSFYQTGGRRTRALKGSWPVCLSFCCKTKLKVGEYSKEQFFS